MVYPRILKWDTRLTCKNQFHFFNDEISEKDSEL